MKIAVVGGGAAGFFAALAAKEANPQASVYLFESSAKVLSKVRISGGGRCNVTHACFEPRDLVKNYPRGSKELLGPLHHFQPRDTIAWFKKRGVKLKQEADGRMFPVTDSSETIIDCFLKEIHRTGVQLRNQHRLKSVERVASGFALHFAKQPVFTADRLILATGSSKAGWEVAKSLGHSIQAPVPSLFTFNIPGFSLVELSGVSIPEARLRLEGSRLEQTGPLLITHWGFSGPAALKLSAFAARFLAEGNYQTKVVVDWLPSLSDESIRQQIQEERQAHPEKQLSSLRLFSLPKKLWKALCLQAGLKLETRLSSLGKDGLKRLCQTLKASPYEVKGKTTNKDEFVTCGGVTLSELSFKSMESRLCPGLYFCGEVLDVDGVTGGFNFQNAWTTGWIAGQSSSFIN